MSPIHTIYEGLFSASDGSSSKVMLKGVVEIKKNLDTVCLSKCVLILVGEGGKG